MLPWTLVCALSCAGPVPPAGPDPRLTLGPVRTCADPAARDAAPFDRIWLDGWPSDGSQTLAGRGVSIDDLDGDGHLDLFVPRAVGPSRFFFGDGAGGFEDRSDEAHPSGITDAFGASTVDLEPDGDVDLVVYRASSPPVVLRNDGAGHFAGEPHPEWDHEVLGCGGAAAWGDVDLDGDLDLFYGRLGKYDEPRFYSCPSALLLNDGTGAFVDGSLQLPAYVQQVRVMAAGWFNVDDDAWPELYVVVDLPQVLDGDRLVDNDGVLLTTMSGTGLEVDLAGMGLAAGDVNDDGVVDFAVPGIDQIAVMVSAAPGIWVDRAQAWGITAGPGQSVGWGGEWVDLDADGWLDLPMGYGTIPYAPMADQPDEIYRNLGGDAGFERVGAAWGFADRFATRGFAVGDLNGDGWPDLAKREVGGRVAVDLSRCGDAHTLTVALVDPTTPNVDGIGATIEIDVGERTLSRTITAGSTSYASSGPPEALFGLGDATEVDALRVRWPNGGSTAHPGFAADRRVVVSRE
ncbi:MAG: CRTAC1 family protein [Myxococcota bacterium]